MSSLTKEIQEADLVITVRYRGGMKAIKNRTGETDRQLDLAEFLELLQDYQPDILRNPISEWITQAKRYLALKVFW